MNALAGVIAAAATPLKDDFSIVAPPAQHFGFPFGPVFLPTLI